MIIFVMNYFELKILNRLEFFLIILIYSSHERNMTKNSNLNKL